MTTVVELDVPAERLGLAPTFERVPTFEFQVAGLIGDAPPLVRVSGSDRRTIERALEADSSIEVIANLSESADQRPEQSDDEHEYQLFRLKFGDGVDLFEEIVTDNDGAILSAQGTDNSWSLQLLFHEHEMVSACHDLFQQYEFGVTVTRVAGTDDLDRAQTPLTETQYETICAAHELGYFDVPRKVTLEELASELGISHQALSERLRRSHAALVSAELSGGLTPAPIDP
ncbi:helix-turn-helix domain-containing protein [Natrialbaceae archaeon A-arb3/5]